MFQRSASVTSLFNHNYSPVTRIAFTQICLGFPDLSNDFRIKGCVPDPKCACGVEKEYASHFFIHCPKIITLREEMKSIIFNICRHVTLSATECVFIWIISIMRIIFNCSTLFTNLSESQTSFKQWSLNIIRYV